MDLKQARALESETEAKIQILLRDFEKDTGLRVREIIIKRSSIVRGFETPPISGVKIAVEL